eukprot:19112-Heterococcus_DN1.PRE.2
MCTLINFTNKQQCGQWEQAEKIVQDMIECNVQPDQYTYNSLINAYAKKGQWAKALAAIATMRDKSCSAVSISALLLLALLSTATITTAEQYCHYIILHYSQYYTITATVTATSCSY